MLGIAEGCPPPNPEELAEHFAPSFFKRVPADQLLVQWTQLAPTMLRVTHMVEESSSDQYYFALLGSPDGWLRYSCIAQDGAK
jgi:hypothetical protein